MFSLLTGVYDSYLAPSQLNLLVVGAPSVGKTTLLERLKVTQIPKRPGKAGPQTPPLALTQALHEAFAKGGAEAPDITSCAFSETTGSETDSTSVVKAVPAPTKPAPAPVVVQKRRFKLSICPAPERYSRSSQDQEEDFIIEEPEPAQPPQPSPPTTSVVPSDHVVEEDDDDDNDEEMVLPLDTPVTPEAPRRVRCHSKEFSVQELDILNSAPKNSNEETDPRTTSMEDIPLDDIPKLPSLRSHLSMPSSLLPESSMPLLQDTFEEIHVKPKAKMLPMSKIRPTIGTNLGKIEMYGAKCHFFDVGGRLQDLWERYYDDCDAVIFCWRLGEDPDASPKEDDEDEEPFDVSKQQEILNQVRKSISDDVPFLVFGHVFGNVNVELVDKMYATDAVLPRYHNNLTGMCCGSAKTGAGVQHAMEWLIPLAKRQQKERIAARKKLEEEKEL